MAGLKKTTPTVKLTIQQGGKMLTWILRGGLLTVRTVTYLSGASNLHSVMLAVGPDLPSSTVSFRKYLPRVSCPG